MIKKIHNFSGWGYTVLVIHPYKHCTVYGNNAVLHCNQSRSCCKFTVTEICKILPFYNYHASAALTVPVGQQQAKLEATVKLKKAVLDNKFIYSDYK